MNEHFKRKDCFLNPYNVADWVAEDLKAYGKVVAKHGFESRAQRCEAMVFEYCRYVDCYAEPLILEAGRMWKDAANSV